MPAKPINITKQLRKIPRASMFSIPLDIPFPTSWMLEDPSTTWVRDPVEFVHPHNTQHPEDVSLYGVMWWGSLMFRFMNQLENIYHSDHEPVIVSGTPSEPNHPNILGNFQICKGDFPFMICVTDDVKEIIDFAQRAFGEDYHPQLSLLSSTILGLRDLPYSPSDVVWQHFVNGVRNSADLATNQVCRLIQAEGSLRVILPWLDANVELAVDSKFAWLAISTALCAYKAASVPIPQDESWIYNPSGGWFKTQIQDFLTSFTTISFEDYAGNSLFGQTFTPEVAVDNIQSNLLRVSYGRVDLKAFGEEPTDGTPPFIPTEEERLATQLDSGLDFTQIGHNVFDTFFKFWHPMKGDTPKQGSFNPWYKVKRKTLPYADTGKMTTYEVELEDKYDDLSGTEQVSYQVEKENRSIEELIPSLAQLEDGSIVCGISLYAPFFEQEYGSIKVHVRPCMTQVLKKTNTEASRVTQLRAVNNDCYHITVLDSSGYSSAANLQNWMLPSVTLTNQEDVKQITKESDKGKPPGQEEGETMRDDWKWVLIIIGAGLLLLFMSSNDDK